MNSITFTGDTPYLKRIVDAVLALDPVTSEAKPKKQKAEKAPEPQPTPPPVEPSAPEPAADEPPMEKEDFSRKLTDFVLTHPDGTEKGSEIVKSLYRKFDDNARKASDIPESRRREFLAALAA